MSEMSKMSGAQLIAAERQRQIESEGWTAEHDDELGAEHLELAALCYRDAAGSATQQPTFWPLPAEWWKPQDRRRNLERAGALYQAAADTADRAEDYKLRDQLRGQVDNCSIFLDSISR
ncbi:hypothetical protein [Pseudomonas guariconensis]|uniref:hypothetical protein n=1 Tax=Pseudomonas guariconensis TaxID=1288410 RepID=UPI003905A763